MLTWSEAATAAAAAAVGPCHDSLVLLLLCAPFLGKSSGPSAAAVSGKVRAVSSAGVEVGEDTVALSSKGGYSVEVLTASADVPPAKQVGGRRT